MDNKNNFLNQLSYQINIKIKSNLDIINKAVNKLKQQINYKIYLIPLLIHHYIV